MNKKITNIYLGAAFMLMGAQFLGADHSDKDHVMYEFESPVLDLREIQARWISGKLVGTFNLCDYAVHLKRLKEELYIND